MSEEYPICKCLECGCYIEDWGDIRRIDYCEKHGKERMERTKDE